MWKHSQSLDQSISMTEMNLCLLMSIILSSCMPFFPRAHGAHRAPTPPVAMLCRQHLQFQAECQESKQESSSEVNLKSLGKSLGECQAQAALPLGSGAWFNRSLNALSLRPPCGDPNNSRNHCGTSFSKLRWG